MENTEKQEYIELLKSVIETDKETLKRNDLSKFLRSFYEDRVEDYTHRLEELENEKLHLEENDIVTESMISADWKNRAQQILDENPDCYCVFYGYQYKNDDAVEIDPEVFTDRALYSRRISQIIKAFNRYYASKTVYAKSSDFIFYTIFNKNDSKLSEEIESENSTETRIEYKGFYIVDFIYDVTYGDETYSDLHGVVLLHKKLTDKNGFDIVIYAEDENENDVNFKTIDDAKNWIDKYADKIVFKVKNRDEIHATIDESAEK